MTTSSYPIDSSGAVPTADDNGNVVWRLNGKLHRLDGPAIEAADGTKVWYLDGLRHRLDGPAIEWLEGAVEYWVNGLRHRLDGPAVETEREAAPTRRASG